MLLPDNIYQKIPRFWMVLGIMFVMLALVTGPSYDLFPIYLGVGFLCIGRSLWIYQARWKYFLKNEVKSMRSTQIIDRAKVEPRDDKEETD